MKKYQKVNELHSKAMDIAERAFIAQRKAQLDKAKQLSQEALIYEREAAMLLLNDYDIEPTRSVLFRSAACLALDFDDYREAEKMIAFGLSGNPPREILEELRDLLISHIPIRPTKPVSISLKQRRPLPVSPPVAVGV